MSEILLQAIVEKLEALEIALLKGNDTGKDDLIRHGLLKETKSLQSEMTKLPSQFKTSAEKISELLKNIAALNFKLENPVGEQIKHSHHLHKGTWIAIGLFILSLLFLYGWIHCNNAKNLFETNDIK